MDLAHRASNGDRAAVSRPAQVFPLYISTTIQTILSRRLPVMTYPHFTMFLSCYQFLLQLFLKSLGSLFASAQQVLQLVTFSTEISTAPPLQCEPESDALVDAEKPVYENCDRHLDRETNTFTSKPSPHPLQPSFLYKKILAFIDHPLLAVGISGNKSEETISRIPFEVDNPTLERDIPTLQPVHAVLARLAHFCIYSSPTPPKEGILVSTSIASRLFQFSKWLKIAKVLAYAYAALQNPELKDAEQIFDIGGMTMDVAEGILSLLPRTPITTSNPSTPISPIFEGSALSGRHFIPSSPSLLGFIEEPKGRPLCAGGYSDVWRCNVQFRSPSKAPPTKVAVKVLRSVWLSGSGDADANEHLLQRFEQEAITWSGLPRHPNIVPLVGWTLTPNPSFISPWYRNGNLYRHLKGLSETRKLHILVGIAKGLACLHSCSPPVAHGDLKPENILLSDGGEPLLADFSLSTILGKEMMYTASHRIGGSVRWMSPEQMVEGSRSCQSDAYSFGTLAFTVMTGELPYPRLTDSQITFKVYSSRDSNGPVEDWSEYAQLQGPIKDLLQECWSRSPGTRPSMSTIVRQLALLLASRKLESHILSM